MKKVRSIYYLLAIIALSLPVMQNNGKPLFFWNILVSEANNLPLGVKAGLTVGFCLPVILFVVLLILNRRKERERLEAISTCVSLALSFMSLTVTAITVSNADNKVSYLNFVKFVVLLIGFLVVRMMGAFKESKALQEWETTEQVKTSGSDLRAKKFKSVLADKSKVNKVRSIYYVLAIAALFLPVMQNLGRPVFFWDVLGTINLTFTVRVSLGVGFCLPIILYAILFFLKRKRSIEGLEAVFVFLSLVISFALLIASIIVTNNEDNVFDYVNKAKFAVIIIGFLVVRMIGAFEESRVLQAAAKEKAEALKTDANIDENQRRLRDKVRKMPYLERIAGKMYRKNLRNTIMLFIGAVISSSFLFIVIALYRIFRQAIISGQMKVGAEIADTLYQAIILIGVISVLLLALALQPYVLSRVKDYHLLRILGANKYIIHRLIVVEYVGTLVLAYLTSLAVGPVIVMGFRRIIADSHGGGLVLSAPDWLTYLIAFGVTILLFLVSSIINYEVLVETEMGKAGNEYRNEALTIRYKKYFLGGGIIIMAIAGMTFRQRVARESVYWLIVFVVGVYLAFVGGSSLCLYAYRKSGRGYYKKLPVLQQIYGAYKSQMRNFILLFGLHFFLMGYFLTRIASLFPLEDQAVISPYDYVVLGDLKDEKWLNDFGTKQGADFQVVPMVRITVPSVWEGNTGYSISNDGQGQQIGVSATTYQKLSNQKIDLTGHEIAIFFQQKKSDIAHLLDFSTLINPPRMRAGMADPHLPFDIDIAYQSDYIVKVQDRQNIIGDFTNGRQEQVIVFSDEYFAQIYQTGNGPAMLGLYKMKGDYDKNNVKSNLSDYAKEHQEYVAYDSVLRVVYQKEEAKQNMIFYNWLRLLVYSLVAVLISICVIYVLLARYITEYPRLSKQLKQYSLLGMHKKMIRRCLAFYSYFTSNAELVSALPAAGIFIFSSLRLRYFTAAERKMFWQHGLQVTIIYIVVQMLISVIIYQLGRHRLKQEGIL